MPSEDDATLAVLGGDAFLTGDEVGVVEGLDSLSSRRDEADKGARLEVAAEETSSCAESGDG